MKIDARVTASLAFSRTRIVLIALFAWLLLAIVSATNWVADAESVAEPSVCTDYTPRVNISPDHGNVSYIWPIYPPQTRGVLIQVYVPQCGTVANPDPPINGTVTVSMLSYMTIASATPHPNYGGSITGGGQSVTYSHGRMADLSGPGGVRISQVSFTAQISMPYTIPVSR